MHDQIDETLAYLYSLLNDPKPTERPSIENGREKFEEVADYILALRGMLSRMARGNLRSRITYRGYTAYCMKELQAQLRNLVWHAERIASGDFTEHIDFSGAYSEPLNQMSRRFYDMFNELKKLSDQLYLSEERWTLAIACTKDGIWDIDLLNNTVYFSKRMWEILRYPPQDCNIEFDFEEWMQNIHPDDIPVWQKVMKIIKAESSTSEDEGCCEFRVRGGDGLHRWVSISFMLLKDKQCRPIRFIGACEDIQERREREETIRIQATHDQLTGLPNRYLYNDRLEQQMVMAKRNNTSLILVVWDLDGFKRINDTYGHLAGDDLLIQVSERMKKCLRETDTLARFGGDEFVMILTAASGHEKEVISTTTRRIFDMMRAEFTVCGQSERIGISSGASLFPRHTRDADTLFGFADKALYMAKEQGKNRLVVWSP